MTLLTVLGALTILDTHGFRIIAMQNCVDVPFLLTGKHCCLTLQDIADWLGNLVFIRWSS